MVLFRLLHQMGPFFKKNKMECQSRIPKCQPPFSRRPIKMICKIISEKIFGGKNITLTRDGSIPGPPRTNPAGNVLKRSWKVPNLLEGPVSRFFKKVLERAKLGRKASLTGPVSLFLNKGPCNGQPGRTSQSAVFNGLGKGQSTGLSGSSARLFQDIF